MFLMLKLFDYFSITANYESTWNSEANLFTRCSKVVVNPLVACYSLLLTCWSLFVANPLLVRYWLQIPSLLSTHWKFTRSFLLAIKSLLTYWKNSENYSFHKSTEKSKLKQRTEAAMQTSAGTNCFGNKRRNMKALLKSS